MDSLGILAILQDLPTPHVQGKACFSDGCKQHLSLRLVPVVLWEERSGVWLLVTVTAAKAAHPGFVGD